MSAIHAAAQRARRRRANASPGTLPGAALAPSASAHRFADVSVQGETERTIERGPFPLRFSVIGGRTIDSATAANGEPRHGDELPLWNATPGLDLLERGASEHSAGVKAVDLALEPYRTADGLERGLTPLIDALGARLRFDSAKHVLHLELSGEPTSAQLEGLARLRDYARRRSRETGIELAVHVAAPSGRSELRPPKP